MVRFSIFRGLVEKLSLSYKCHKTSVKYRSNCFATEESGIHSSCARANSKVHRMGIGGCVNPSILTKAIGLLVMRVRSMLHIERAELRQC